MVLNTAINTTAAIQTGTPWDSAVAMGALNLGISLVAGYAVRGAILAEESSAAITLGAEAGALTGAISTGMSGRAASATISFQAPHPVPSLPPWPLPSAARTRFTRHPLRPRQNTTSATLPLSCIWTRVLEAARWVRMESSAPRGS